MLNIALGAAADIAGRISNIYNQRKAANEHNKLQNLKRRINEDRQFNADTIQHNLSWQMPDDKEQY